MNRIVFVEDDPDVGSLIAAYLSRHDIEVIVESRGDRAEATIAAVSPDLVMLDIMLPGKDGMTLCRDLRAGKSWTGPLVLLTSLDSDMNHILALEMGASDYILKTTPPAVLLARLRLHLRQAGSGTTDAVAAQMQVQKPLCFGTLSVDPVNRQVTLGGDSIPLSTADFDLLWELATHAGTILNRDALLQALRGVAYDGLDRSIDVAISRLRRKLLDSATEPYRIKTIRNKGYLFAPHAWDMP
uniref:two-component system response regulator RstA n=1 Tax=Pantoea sp. IMH TaxID=1267600 RepID=UPI0004680CD8|nr:two-component system response regulator RstA [Pantoea sp. IMH]